MAEVVKDAGVRVARIAGRSPVMDGYAEGLETMVRGFAARHIQTGHYMSSIGVATVPGRSGVMDRVVFSDDPQAHIIEWGHWNKDHTKWTPGQYIFQRAYEAVKSA